MREGSQHAGEIGHTAPPPPNSSGTPAANTLRAFNSA
jgi:hypothetical protein